ncbi:MAG: trypsin-like peptidase domain-containing protein [Patescibacteria group bacterium]
MRRERSKIITTVRRVMPAVVSIIITKSLRELETELTPKEKRQLKNHTLIPADKIDAHGMVQVGGGSGFIVEPSGIVLTNKHVIAESNASYTVITNDNERYEAQVLARDPVNDVAILRIVPGRKLPAVELGNSDTLELGQTVLAIGNALGIFKNTVSSGIVSGLSRSVSAQADPTSPPQELRGLIQTDAAINPGNSGGPLVDIFGTAVGVNAAVVYGAQNINFAIPIKVALRDLADLKQYGRIRRPLLGLRYLTLNQDLKEKLGLPTDRGAFVTKEHPYDAAVVSGTPAALAGIREHDIIIAWNGKLVTPEKSIGDYLDDASVGETVTLAVLRDGREAEFPVTLAERK